MKQTSQTNIRRGDTESPTIKVTKAVTFGYIPTPLTVNLLETFRLMVNEAISICLKEDIQGRLRLRTRIYEGFKAEYGVVAGFPYSVAEVAWSIVKKHRKWNRIPVAKRLMMKMEAQKYSINHLVISLPFKKGTRVVIPLICGEYQQSYLTNQELRRGSVTITEEKIIVAFSAQLPRRVPTSRIGIDLNEKSAVCSDGSKYDLSEVARVHTEYGLRRAHFHRIHPRDRRLMHSYASSLREKERVRQVLHRDAKKIVQEAKTKNQSLVLERLGGVRYAHKKGNGESKKKRARVALWPFGLLQSYISYKAAWNGVRVEFVSAAWTSKICHNCRRVNGNLKVFERSWQCPSCGCQLDRDLNAAINIERRGKVACLDKARPGAQGRHEAMRRNEPVVALARRAEVLKPTIPLTSEVGRAARPDSDTAAIA